MKELSEVTKMTEANSYNLPNLLFQQYCEKVYGINRGVFNTVEISFFYQGNTDIVLRRDGMLRFFQFMVDKLEISTNKNNKLKFGHGGLQAALNEFMIESGRPRHVRQLGNKGIHVKN